MVDDDMLSWSAPPCPLCGADLDLVPVGTGAGIRIGYTCDTHGLVIVTNPLDDSVFRPAVSPAPTPADVADAAARDGS